MLVRSEAGAEDGSACSDATADLMCNDDEQAPMDVD